MLDFPGLYLIIYPGSDDVILSPATTSHFAAVCANDALLYNGHNPHIASPGRIDNESQASCGEHDKELCEECGVDYRLMNGLARIFTQNPQLLAPPPPQVVQQQRSLVVNKMKEDGNVRVSGSCA